MPWAAAGDPGRGLNMFLKNEAARLITINYVADGVKSSYQILPGENPAVEVPNAVAKIDFVKVLIANGDLRVADASEAESDGNDDDDIAALREEAGRAGVKVDKRWNADRLREEIAKAGA